MAPTAHGATKRARPCAISRPLEPRASRPHLASPKKRAGRVNLRKRGGGGTPAVPGRQAMPLRPGQIDRKRLEIVLRGRVHEVRHAGIVAPPPAPEVAQL